MQTVKSRCQAGALTACGKEKGGGGHAAECSHGHDWHCFLINQMHLRRNFWPVLPDIESQRQQRSLLASRPWLAHLRERIRGEIGLHRKHHSIFIADHQEGRLSTEGSTPTRTGHHGRCKALGHGLAASALRPGPQVPGGHLLIISCMPPQLSCSSSKHPSACFAVHIESWAGDEQEPLVFGT